jgi:hypothetical protein
MMKVAGKHNRIGMAETLDSELFKEQVNSYLNDTMEARSLSERDRDYYDHKQWTAAEVAKLKARNQAPIVVNRIKPKIEGLIGLYNMRQTDPKVYPRTQKHEEASHVITDALRYVADNNDFDALKLDVAEDMWVEGVGGGIVEVRQKKNGEVEVVVSRIPWDRLYYDPHSREKDFSDAQFKGMMLWLNEDQFNTLFPDADFDDFLLEGADGMEDGDTFQDRPRWQDRERKRVRVAYHFFLEGGEWKYAIFSGSNFIIEPEVSPFLDDDGEPTCIIELVSVNVDRNNCRYGEVRGFIDLQDEINHRRSKAIHTMSERQTFGRRGMTADVKAIKRELGKADGHIEFNGDAFGKDFGILPTNDMTQGQLAMYEDAKGELDAVSVNAQLSGERQSGDLSGKAIQKLQAAGTLELNRQFLLINRWEKRIYRQMWARIKQFWNEEKWIRVTDDQDNLRWVGLNSQVTAQQWMEEQIEDESLPLDKRQQLTASLQFLMQGAQQGSPEAAQALTEIIEVKNDTSEVDVDIIIEQSFDVINADEEQFNAIIQYAQNGDVDIIDLIELAPNIRNKGEIIDKIEQRRAAQVESASNIAQQEQQTKQVQNMKDFESAKKIAAETQLIQVEAATLVQSPDPNPQVTT